MQKKLIETVGRRSYLSFNRRGGNTEKESIRVLIKGSEQDCRIRIMDYRAVYQVDVKTKIVTIYHVRHRREAHRK